MCVMPGANIAQSWGESLTFLHLSANLELHNLFYRSGNYSSESQDWYTDYTICRQDLQTGHCVLYVPRYEGTPQLFVCPTGLHFV